MRKNIKTLSSMIFLPVILMIVACAPPASNTVDESAVATIVAGTLGAMQSSQDSSTEAQATQAPAQNTAVPENVQDGLSTVSGDICFPSEGIPEMTVYLQNTASNQVTLVAISQNQGSFSAELTVGNYQAYAWLPDFSASGSYSQMVPCGLSASCNDHSLISFDVIANQDVAGIDVCDWYGGPGTVPYPPGVDANSLTGSISGNLNYPSEYIPAMQIVAFNINTQFWYMTSTSEGTSTYQINDLPPGEYQVVTYALDSGIGGGYSFAVPCGLSVECTDHNLIIVTVVSGQNAAGIDPADWYAPEGAFPQNPAP